MTTKEDLTPEVRKLYDQLEEDLRAMLCEFEGMDFNEHNKKVMANTCAEYFEFIIHLNMEEEE